MSRPSKEATSHSYSKVSVIIMCGGSGSGVKSGGNDSSVGGGSGGVGGSHKISKAVN